jgi:DNA excision repair protein ERCC-3
LGRILRPKSSGKKNPYNAFFYSLISQDTRDMYFSQKRQKFLINQGYSYKIILNVHKLIDMEDSTIPTIEKEKEILEITKKNKNKEEKQGKLII